MKKITAILLAVVMIVCALAVSASAFKDNVFPEEFLWIATDQYAYAGAWLWAAGNSDDFVKDNPPAYELHDGNPGYFIEALY